MPSGGYRPGAGRPRKNPADKKLEGKEAAPRAAPPPLKKVQAPNVMAEYFSMALKECEKEVPAADALRAEIEGYIASRGCEGYIAPQTITDYVLNRQGFLACECMNRKIGRMFPLPDQNAALLAVLHNSPSPEFDFGVTQK